MRENKGESPPILRTSHLDHVPPSNRLEFLVQPIHSPLRRRLALRRHLGLVAAPYQDLLLRAQLLLHRGHALRLCPITLAVVPVPLLLVLHQLDHLRADNSSVYSGRILNKFLSAQLLGIKRERGTRKEENYYASFLFIFFRPPISSLSRYFCRFYHDFFNFLDIYKRDYYSEYLVWSV